MWVPKHEAPRIYEYWKEAVDQFLDHGFDKYSGASSPIRYEGFTRRENRGTKSASRLYILRHYEGEYYFSTTDVIKRPGAEDRVIIAESLDALEAEIQLARL